MGSLRITPLNVRVDGCADGSWGVGGSCNPASTPLWQEYLDFLKSWEETSPLDKGNKMTAIRKVGVSIVDRLHSLFFVLIESHTCSHRYFIDIRFINGDTSGQDNCF